MNKRIEKLDNFGRGITYIDDKIAFVSNALDGELIDLERLEEHKKYIICKNNRVLDKSTEREENVCPYFLKCGGCNIFHMKEEKELEFKKMRAKDLLLHYAGISIKDIDVSFSKFLGYRNKITLRVENGKLGLLEEESNNIVFIDKCLIADKKINEEISILRSLIKDEDINKIVIRTGDGIMLSLYGNVKNIDKFKKICTSLYINDECITNKYITKELGSKKYHIRNKSFFQVNDEVAYLLYENIRALVSKIKPLNVLDLYCGVGSIGIYIADCAMNVTGIEVESDAIKDAEENKRLNNINNIRFINNKVENSNINLDLYDLVIVDPPRRGLDNKTVNMLNDSNLKNIIYVSCDVITLGRDIKSFTNYDVIFIKIFNMFPRTYHFETLCLLEKNN